LPLMRANAPKEEPMLGGKRVFRLARHLSSQSVKKQPVVFTGLLLLCVLLITAPSNHWPYAIAKANSANKIATQSGEAKPLTLGVPIERELAGGETHSYQIAILAGHFVQVVVEQKGIDVVVKVFGPDGKQLLQVDSPNGTQGPETVVFVTESAGTYHLEVSSPEKNAKAGRYEAKLVELRTATQPDRDRIAAEMAFAEGKSLSAQGTKASRE